MLEPFLIVVFESLSCPQCEKMDLKIIQSLLDILSEREKHSASTDKILCLFSNH